MQVQGQWLVLLAVSYSIEMHTLILQVEVQKLLKQNEIMESHILEMEGEITVAVEDSDVSSRDKQ